MARIVILIAEEICGNIWNFGLAQIHRYLLMDFGAPEAR